MSNAKYILMCGGDSPYWEMHTGVTKHFAVLNGEPIILRTIRLLKENGVDGDDIYVSSNDYNIEGVNNEHTVAHPELKHTDPFLSTRHLWNDSGRTVFVFGDVYFSEEAIKTIVTNKRKDWCLLARPWASKATGTPYGEPFALSVYPDHLEKSEQQLRHLLNLHNTGVTWRSSVWEWSRMVDGVPDTELNPHREDLKCYEVIDDITDDIDFPKEYENMVEAISKWND